ncbi:metallophosphoesterase [Nitrincola sp. A-D6]|uniref:metallophosphoesterase n=1 Tax=Nitrincola sp. A-D6 TaxID=1545442 RepID=UPI000B1559C3|nr:metallophosphoesterase family protein [Nitrincola sp. A-D6]
MPVSTVSTAIEPEYTGQEWLRAHLPTRKVQWLDGAGENWHQAKSSNKTELTQVLHYLSDHDHWRWPEHLVLFLTDLHADAEAFSASLVASGVFARNGPDPSDLSLKLPVDQFEIILGGDCLDKGPSNLQLLRLIRHLLDKQVQLTLLSGNHDLRLQLAIQSLDNPNCPRNGHFLLRLGSKVMPLCVELLSQYPLSDAELSKLPDESSCEALLLPTADWPDQFRKGAADTLSPAQIELELERLTSRKLRFFTAARRADLSFQQIYAAMHRWKQLFLQPDGEFHWFIKHQQLLCRRGSFLFVHAGCDDTIARQLVEQDCDRLNQAFQEARQGEAFALYFGPLGNMLRTKYRQQDPLLSSDSSQELITSGIHALVHGHRNLHHGQRITFRANMIHFECDSTLNSSTRKLEGLSGEGAAVTLIHPQGYVMGISSDYPSIKLFRPDSLQSITHQLL